MSLINRNGISRLDLIILILMAGIGVIMIIPMFQKSDLVLIKQAHQTERLKYDTLIELHSMDNEGMYPKSMKPKDWLGFEKYFPQLAVPSLDTQAPLYCNQGANWEINPDHKLSLLGHGGHE